MNPSSKVKTAGFWGAGTSERVEAVLQSYEVVEPLHVRELPTEFSNWIPFTRGYLPAPVREHSYT